MSILRHLNLIDRDVDVCLYDQCNDNNLILMYEIRESLLVYHDNDIASKLHMPKFGNVIRSKEECRSV